MVQKNRGGWVLVAALFVVAAQGLASAQEQLILQRSNARLV